MAGFGPNNNNHDDDHQHKQQQQQQTHYQVLQVSPSASLQDIKKAYRKLALLHHPDRNPPEQKEESTLQFRLVNEAYQVLSDPDQRAQYDADLQSGFGRFGSSGGGGGGGQTQQHYRPRYSGPSYRDPFAQFNDLFQNDPFFQEAFRDMENQFAKTFHNTNHVQQQQQQLQQQQQQQPKKSWGRWIADCLGIDLQITTSTTTVGLDGRPQTSSTSTHYGGGGGRGSRRSSSSTTGRYTSKSTRTVIENGQRVTIQSMEQDGNRIEEKYINNEMVQRLINGIPEQQYRIGQTQQNGGGRSDGGDL